MASDIINSILDKFKEIIVLELSSGSRANDPLKIAYCEKFPFQEDPTEVAPYVWMQLDKEKGRIPDPDFPSEIGGGVRWVNYFVLEGRIPQLEDKELAYIRLGVLNRRVIRALRQNWDLSDVVSDDGEEVTLCDPRIITKNTLNVFGGETEWFGEFTVELVVRSTESADDWQEI